MLYRKLYHRPSKPKKTLVGDPQQWYPEHIHILPYKPTWIASLQPIILLCFRYSYHSFPYPVYRHQNTSQPPREIHLSLRYSEQLPPRLSFESLHPRIFVIRGRFFYLSFKIQDASVVLVISLVRRLRYFPKFNWEDLTINLCHSNNLK